MHPRGQSVREWQLQTVLLQMGLTRAEANAAIRQETRDKERGSLLRFVGTLSETDLGNIPCIPGEPPYRVACCLHHCASPSTTLKCL